MKITFWIQGSGKPIEYEPDPRDHDDWVGFLDALQDGSFPDDFIWLDDGDVQHYVRVSLIDVIKVEYA